MSADFLPLMPTSPPTSNVRRLFSKRPALLLESWPCTSTATPAFVCAAGATLLSTCDTTRSVRANSSYRPMASMAISYLIATERSSWGSKFLVRQCQNVCYASPNYNSLYCERSSTLALLLRCAKGRQSRPCICRYMHCAHAWLLLTDPMVSVYRQDVCRPLTIRERQHGSPTTRSRPQWEQGRWYTCSI
jgi:hypothetical protein